MTPLFQRQLVELQEAYPGTSATSLPSGAQLVEVPNLPLPQGWDRTKVTVYFLVPVGYPAATPDCFWTDRPFLRLQNRAQPPQNTNEVNPIPEVPELKGTWFSWHLQEWNP